MPNQSLNQLIAPWIDHLPEIEFQAMVLDHRQIKSGDLFVAIQGHHVDARQWISGAVSAGAAAVLSDLGEIQQHFEVEYQGQVPIIHFPHLKSCLSEIAASYYQYPSQRLQVIGVTGTNGKTTVSQLVAQWQDLLGRKAAVMGTTGNGFLNQLDVAPNTTGSPIEIQDNLAQFVEKSATDVVMEVSSHGLVQERVKAVKFDAVIFTNLSRDHLDYHGTMEAYAEAKLRLFTHYGAKVSVINADDPVGQGWISQMPETTAVAMTQESVNAHQGKKLWLEQVSYSTTGVTIHFDSSWGAGQFQAPLVGEFNVMNLLLSLATLLGLGFEKQSLLETARQLKPVIGRMEVFSAPNAPMQVVDYAHTPDALEKALTALRRHCQGRLWCVFGCGGDRDSGKRPMMGELAQRLADEVILTDDNPRSESPAQIIHEIQSGMKQKAQVHVIHDRWLASRYAFEHAHPEDVILIAGKGHEDYQITALGTKHYSDRETVEKLLKEIK